MFLEQLKQNLSDGILLLVKYGFIIAAIIYAFNFLLNTYRAAANGEQAAMFLQELQKKGYLPQLVNGQVPDRPKVEEKK